jgi:hypothetical protein
MADNDAGEIIHALQRFTSGFKGIRSKIESMNDDELIELYDRAKEISNVSWLIRCIILGTAHERAVKGDRTVVELAETFGIGRRMAELDIQVYNTFIKENQDFEPLLPAAFYQLAVRHPNPEGAIGMALEMKAEKPKYTSSEFGRLLKGDMGKEQAEAGFYILVPSNVSLDALMQEANLDETGTSELHGKTRLYSIGGNLYADIS